MTRPAIANEWHKLNSTGDVVLRIKGPYKNGTTHIAMSSLEFIQKVGLLTGYHLSSSKSQSRHSLAPLC
ncbi:MAG: hypothetical protein GY807_04830 [Gammaproteobacteria bacterium]|nr:hypothetical protein [Gammaproteobacteria bacterium]